jgi:ATPase subunit of ABC transporter with duplicated ATPase domains
MLDKIVLDEIVPSSRKYPFVEFKPERETGKEVLTVKNVSKTIDGKKVLNNVSFIMQKGDKIAFVGTNNIAKTALFKILMGEEKPDSGTVEWGKTVKCSYMPQDNTEYFNREEDITEWMGRFYHVDDVTVLRGFLGRMLFSGEEVFRKVKVLSGGEKARCMLSKIMLEAGNVIILDEPTNHLDLESITSLNNGLIKFNGELLFSSHDHQFVQTTANRIIELTENGLIDRMTDYDTYLEEKMKNENK